MPILASELQRLIALASLIATMCTLKYGYFTEYLLCALAFMVGFTAFSKFLDTIDDDPWGMLEGSCMRAAGIIGIQLVIGILVGCLLASLVFENTKVTS